MKPSDLSLPAKFSAFRDPQLDELERILTVSNKRFIARALPTGFGKTLWYIAYVKLLAEELGKPVKAVILTASKALQTQILNDFSSIGLVDIRGRNNYRCNSKYGDCDHGYDAGCSYSATLNCPYLKAANIAANSSLIVTNYSYWLHARNGGSIADNGLPALSSDTTGSVELLICDEAAEAFEQLAAYLQVHISDEYCLADTPCEGSGVAKDDTRLAWLGWIDANRKALRHAQQNIEDAYTSSVEARHDAQWNTLRKLRDKLRILASQLSSDWAYTVHDAKPTRPNGSLTGVTFDCIWPGKYAQALWSGVPRVLLVSGTLRPYTLQLLGLKPDDYDFAEAATAFPANRAPVYYLPTAKLNKHSSDVDYKLIVEQMDALISSRLDRKGIVHTVSYDRARWAMEHSRYASHFFYNLDSKRSIDTASAFRRAKPPAVLVSPSFSTGWDFPGVEAEYQIILKCPFPDLSSIVMRERCQNRNYMWYTVIQELVQMCGRGMRFDLDRCETFILDKNMSWCRAAGASYAPKKFFDPLRFRQINKVPEAPAKL